jgi:hypothetical protein
VQPQFKPSQLLTLAPAVASRPDATHSALVLSQESFAGKVVFEGSVCTQEQLRVGTANPWETAWLVWNYADNDHFYYFAMKPNGWELGKRDPDYVGGQRFLATGEEVKFEIGAWNRFSIAQDGDRIVISVDGVELVRFQDLERPYVQGRIGLYTEDARVMLDDVRGSLRDDFDGGRPVSLHDGAQVGSIWDVAFLGYGSGGIVTAASPLFGDAVPRAETAPALPTDPLAPPPVIVLADLVFEAPMSGWLLA